MRPVKLQKPIGYDDRARVARKAAETHIQNRAAFKRIDRSDKRKPVGRVEGAW